MPGSRRPSALPVLTGTGRGVYRTATAAAAVRIANRALTAGANVLQNAAVIRTAAAAVGAATAVV